VLHWICTRTTRWVLVNQPSAMRMPWAPLHAQWAAASVVRP